MAIWFTADTHFGHSNIIRHCNRPFASVAEMDEKLLRNINDRVSPEDTLYHLGDFAFRTTSPEEYRAKIRCRKIVLLLGNHDPQTLDGSVKPAFASLFSGVHSLLRIKVQLRGSAQLIVLCHYAMRVWDASHRGSWHLFGHSHGKLPDDAGRLSWDVGVDRNEFAPVSLPAIAEIMARKAAAPAVEPGPPEPTDADSDSK